jgi:hypothetical protein
MANKNFKYLVGGHIVAIIVFGILSFITADKKILLTMLAVVLVSLITQFSIYKKRPEFFDNKTTNQPDLK